MSLPTEFSPHHLYCSKLLPHARAKPASYLEIIRSLRQTKASKPQYLHQRTSQLLLTKRAFVNNFVNTMRVRFACLRPQVRLRFLLKIAVLIAILIIKKLLFLRLFIKEFSYEKCDLFEGVSAHELLLISENSNHQNLP